MEDDMPVGVAFTFAVIVGLFAGLGSCDITKKIHQGKAIKAGVAEWTIDKKTGERSFVFKECGE